MIFYDTEIISIGKEGILLKNKKTTRFVDFVKCVEERTRCYSSNAKASVGSRDITKHVFKFSEKDNLDVHIVIKKKHVFDFSRNRRFIDLQKKINSFGYTTLDLS